MGLFDKLKNKTENNENKYKTFVNLDKNDSLGFCTCGNLTTEKYCNICSKFISNKKRVSMTEFNQITHDKIIIPLSNEYDVNFEEIELKDYFNLDSNEEKHIIYRLMRAIMYEEMDENIHDFFEKIVNQTKNKNDIEKTIMDKIKSETLNKFYNTGYTYDILLTISASGLKAVENTVIKEKHGAIGKILATTLAGPLGFVATSGVKQTTEIKNVYVEGEYAHNQYSFNPKSIVIKSYSDNRNFNAFNPSGKIDKIVVDWKNINYVDGEYSLILKNGELIQTIPPNIFDIANKNIFDIVGTLDEQLNNQLHYKYIDNIINKTHSLLIDLLNQYINKINVSSSNNSNNNDSINNLEKIIQMYENGLLTEEEFAEMKKKLIINN